jgi:hypothetical protein
VIRGSVIQEPYDPYVDGQRARSEEFGDCIAEGVFSLLDSGRHIQNANLGYWRHFLDERRRFIEEITRMIRRTDREPGEERHIIAALAAAHGQNRLMTAQLCVDFLQAWHTDHVRWQRHIREFGREPADSELVLAELGLTECAIYTPAKKAA